MQCTNYLSGWVSAIHGAANWANENNDATAYTIVLGIFGAATDAFNYCITLIKRSIFHKNVK